MSTQPEVNNRQVVSSNTGSNAESSVWWLVCKWELADLWIGGRVFNFLILFSVLMSITVYLMATNSELSLTPPKLTVLIMLQAAITFGLFIGLIVAAESISGERERATFETLLITPTSRLQLVLGKFLAALSPWPAALLLAVPYMVVLAQGDPVLVPALLWGALLGSLLAVTFTALGTLVSIWSNSNRVSLFVSLLLYLLCLLPSQLPGQVQATPALTFIQVIDPVEATNQFLQKVLVNSQPQAGSSVDPGPVTGVWIFLAGSIGVTLLILAVLFLYAAPRLQLEAGRVRTSRTTLNRAQMIKTGASK